MIEMLEDSRGLPAAMPRDHMESPVTDGAADLHIQLASHGFATRTGWTEVLHDIDLRIRAGEFFCLVGQSGCGKTTLLNVIAGFLAPTDGAVYLDGQLLRGPSNDRVVVFQDVHNSLFPWMTVRENVEFGLRMLGRPPDERKRRADALLQLVGLTEHDDKFPDELSGGMKQRVQIARALAIGPKILLMDEPFASLDAQTRRTMQVEVLRIWERTKTSVLFITHDIIEAVTLADRIGVMSKGPAATIVHMLEPSLPRPRAFADGHFANLVSKIDGLLGREANHG
jgi:NitT/TauT family transport system ATP-binding protein